MTILCGNKYYAAVMRQVAYSDQDAAEAVSSAASGVYISGRQVDTLFLGGSLETPYNHQGQAR